MSEPSERQPVRVIPVDDYRLTVERSEQGSCIRPVDRAGAEPSRIELRPEGPALVLGSGLAIAVAGDLQFAAERVAIHARDGIGC